MNDPNKNQDMIFNVNRLNQRILRIVEDMIAISNNVKNIIQDENADANDLVFSIERYKSDSNLMLGSIETFINQLDDSNNDDIKIDGVEQDGGYKL